MPRLISRVPENYLVVLNWRYRTQDQSRLWSYLKPVTYRIFGFAMSDRLRRISKGQTCESYTSTISGLHLCIATYLKRVDKGSSSVCALFQQCLQSCAEKRSQQALNLFCLKPVVIPAPALNQLLVGSPGVGTPIEHAFVAAAVSHKFVLDLAWDPHKYNVNAAMPRCSRS